MSTNIKEFFKSGDVIALICLLVVVALAVVIFGKIEYTPISVASDPIINIISSGSEIVRL